MNRDDIADDSIRIGRMEIHCATCGLLSVSVQDTQAKLVILHETSGIKRIASGTDSIRSTTAPVKAATARI